MKPAAEDLEGRRPVWEALSELFLDTDVSAGRNGRAERLADSAYSIEELEKILMEEVYPICKYNLYAVAGVWEGFDLKWLEEKILTYQPIRFRFLRGVSFGAKRLLRSSDWLATKASVDVLRRAGAENAA